MASHTQTHMHKCKCESYRTVQNTAIATQRVNTGVPGSVLDATKGLKSSAGMSKDHI